MKTMNQIDKIDWAMRSVHFWIESLEGKLSDLEDMGVLDRFNPDDQLLVVLGKLAEAAEDASATCEGAIEEASE